MIKKEYDFIIKILDYRFEDSVGCHLHHRNARERCFVETPHLKNENKKLGNTLRLNIFSLVGLYQGTP